MKKRVQWLPGALIQPPNTFLEMNEKLVGESKGWIIGNWLVAGI